MRRVAVPVMPILGMALVVAVVAGCSREPAPPPQDPRRPSIVVASFDFPESEILAELYGQALRARAATRWSWWRGSAPARSWSPPSNRARSTWSPSTWGPR